jgi:hypothetical protein
MWKKALLLVVAAVLLPGIAHSFRFDVSESVNGNLDMQLTLGAGMRIKEPSSGMVGDPNYAPGANMFQWSNSDDGNLNYRQAQLYTTYLKFTPELLMRFPQDFKFMFRGTAMYDVAAGMTARTDLDKDAERQVVKDAQLLDLWVSKDFNVGSQRGRIRFGNQVVNWGESIFAIGGINATPALDFQKLSIPGTQIKEAVLASPMISLATGLGYGFNVEGYYQFTWSRNRVPPVGSYFSVADIFGKGQQALFISTNNFNFGGRDAASISGARDQGTIKQTQQNAIDAVYAFDGVFDTIAVPLLEDKAPKNGGQWGAALHFKPEGIKLDVGLYYIRYHDKMPVLGLAPNLNVPVGQEAQWTYMEDRDMFGVSANFPVGNWAVGWELSYRPREAVALSGCFDANGNSLLDANTNGAFGPGPTPITCQQWIDQKKYQMHLTGILSLTPGDHGWLLDLLGGAQTGTFTAEAVWIRFPGVSPGTRYTRTFNDANGVPVQVIQAPAAGYIFWMDGVNALGQEIAAGVGSENSFGIVADFNVAYDNKIIEGWQVIPGVTYFQALHGDTPTLTANYLEGAKSINFYVLFNQNPPSKWNAGINFTNYNGGGTDHLRQPLADRDFIGAFITRNF